MAGGRWWVGHGWRKVVGGSWLEEGGGWVMAGGRGWGVGHGQRKRKEGLRRAWPEEGAGNRKGMHACMMSSCQSPGVMCVDPILYLCCRNNLPSNKILLRSYSKMGKILIRIK